MIRREVEELKRMKGRRKEWSGDLAVGQVTGKLLLMQEKQLTYITK